VYFDILKEVRNEEQLKIAEKVCEVGGMHWDMKKDPLRIFVRCKGDSYLWFGAITLPGSGRVTAQKLALKYFQNKTSTFSDKECLFKLF